MNADGTLDGGQLGWGPATTSLRYGPGFTRDAIAYGLGMQSDGKVVLAGAARRGAVEDHHRVTGRVAIVVHADHLTAIQPHLSALRR